MRIDSDLEKFHTKSVAGINYTIRRVLDSGQIVSPPANPFLCHSRCEVYQIIMQREKMLRYDTALSVWGLSASIRYDNCIYNARSKACVHIGFRKVHGKHWISRIIFVSHSTDFSTRSHSRNYVSLFIGLINVECFFAKENKSIDRQIYWLVGVSSDWNCNIN